MASGTSRARKLVSAFLALVFFVAVMPGTMAMPQTPQPAMSASDQCCDHQMPRKSDDNPCKTMKVCLGLLGCLGIAVVVADQPVLAFAAPVAKTPALYVARVGLTHPPDTPPPIV